jgi:nickel-dependent lactate racemase
MGTGRAISADMEQKVGRETVERFQVKNYENNTDLLSLGKSKRGTPV